MNWLSSFYLKHPEYRKLRVARRSPTSIHFELEPRRNGRGGLYEAHFQIRPILERAGRVWMPPEFAALGRLIGASVRNPRVALDMALALPWATVLTLQPDATAGLDTFLDSANPNTNKSTDISWNTGGAVAGRFREVAKFPLTGLPSGAVVSAGSLILNLNTALGSAGNWTISRILVGNSGWTEAGATWNKQDGAANWAGSAGCSTSGTDYSATAMYSGIPGTVLGAQTFVFTLSEVLLMIASNYGFVHFAPNSANNYRFYDSSDHATPANRPQFVITYTVPGGGVFNSPFAAPFRGPFG